MASLPSPPSPAPATRRTRRPRPEQRSPNTFRSCGRSIRGTRTPPLLRTTVERDTSQADAVRGMRWMMRAETKQASELGRGGRMSRQRKRDAVLRLLRGEDLETASRSLGVTAAALTAWRDTFLAAGEAGPAPRPPGGEGLGNERVKGPPGAKAARSEMPE